jgi:ferredoxin-NADP reductase
MNHIQKYQIQAKTRETRDVFIWRLAPREKIFAFQPGQFAMIHLLGKDGIQVGSKPYSIASSPLNKEHLEFGIKVQGEFTKAMAKLNPGGTLGISGPYGTFTYDPDVHQDAVMFAGGIGITPLASMIRFASFVAPANRIFLYYCNQTEQDIAYKNILDELAEKNSNFKIIYSVDKCLTNQWIGETGLINEEKIKKQIADFQGKHFFLCGPPAFMDVVESALTANQVPNGNIKKEVF